MANDYTYRADHVGSLVPPAALIEARAKQDGGALTADGLREIEDAAIKSALDMQRSAGVAVATDGGFRRAHPDKVALAGDSLARTEAAYLKAQSRRPIKVALPAAGLAGEPRELALARAAIVKNEIVALIAAGVDYIQLEAPGYAAALAAGAKARFEDLLEIDKAVLSGLERKANVRIGILLPGFDGSRSSSDNGNEAAAERLFHELPVDRFLLPLDTSGADFELLRLVPAGKLVVLGLVSTTTSALEDVDELMRHIDAAAKILDGNDLALSPASGFFAGTEGRLSEADQRRKLELVADAATRWWGFAM
jgi:5-methyltetrahydropteroyltriglutamate--homocysteine methyltransferase